ncbi:MAG: FtsW/RodA/SpoVE family cell cycle protein [Planctomycetaceae bacterium]|nr:FtsW/RodA/SpoVE family cell cycle protein [Planctomycetaceae bacterium]
MQLRHTLISLACVLLGVGVLMVYSASITARPSAADEIYLARHATFLGFAVACGIVAGLLPATFWRRAAPWLFAATALLLVLVLVPGVGHRVNGAQRWFRFGSVSLQPSEYAKLTIPLFVCWSLDRIRRRAAKQSLSAMQRGIWELRAVVPVAAVIGLVLVEPDLGTAAFLSGVATVTLFLMRWPAWCFLISGLATAPAVVGAALFRPYQLQRIAGFVAGWRDVNAASYQVQQSLTTLGAGGWNGVGLGHGWQKLSFLPEANTDFVFAVVGEELGLIGTLGLLGLWIAMYACGMRLFATVRTGELESVAGRAILIQLVTQAAVNMAVVTALAPPKGIAHPLISYGGSSLLASVIALGMIVSLSRPASETPAS